MSRLLILASKLAFLMFIITGCKKDHSENDLKQRLNGKYAIVSADVNKKIDVNFDGVESTNLLKEITTLKDSYLELIIRNDAQSYVFSQYWQNQYFNTIDGNMPTTYDPKVTVNYMNQATVCSFTINPDGSKLVLSRGGIDLAFPLPESVEILKNQNIQVTMTKSLYTSIGWQNLNLTVVYKKFSSEF